MSASVSRNVDDLPESSRQSIELLIGSPLRAHQRVYIVVDDPIPGPSSRDRLLATQRIRQVIAQAQAHAEQTGISDAQIDAEVEEVMTHVRRRD